MFQHNMHMFEQFEHPEIVSKYTVIGEFHMGLLQLLQPSAFAELRTDVSLPLSSRHFEAMPEDASGCQLRCKLQ